MTRIGVLTSGRQDWGILRSTCAALRADERFELRLLVGGMHLSQEYGETVRIIREDGFEPAELLDWIVSGEPTHAQAGRALDEVGGALSRQGCDALLIVGDRFETAAAAIAATVQGVPIAHLHGGEETVGAFDDALRHAISKLSHIHLVSHPDHAARLVAMGESPDVIHVVGAPGLDNLHRTDLPVREELQRDLGLSLVPPVVLVTVHPTTLSRRTAEDISEVEAVAGAMERVEATYVITLPNTDPGSQAIRSALTRAVSTNDQRVAVEALGDARYWGMLAIADAMLGNSSSGLIEAPALRLPAVNVGDRQGGRIRGANVIDVADFDISRVAEALRRAVAPETRRRLVGTTSPYGDGHSAERILEVLSEWRPRSRQRKAPVMATATA